MTDNQATSLQRDDVSLSNRGALRNVSVRDDLVYAIGDIHGCYELLMKLLSQIALDVAARAPFNKPLLIFCGDYVDRGSESRKVIEALIWLRKAQIFELHLLKGNHEEAMLAYIADPYDSREWLRFGGDQTLSSYGVAPPGGEGSPAQHQEARDLLLEKMPASHLQLLQTLELGVTVGDFAFVHAGVRPRRKLSRQVESDLLWIRDEFLSAKRPNKKIIVHGHTFVGPYPDVTNHRIGIDTGAYETGVLTALRLAQGDNGFLYSKTPSSVKVAQN